MTEEKISKKFYFKKWSVVALIVLCVAISWIGTIDGKAEDYVNDAIVKATVAYGSARALNAVISVAQSAQVGVNFGGEANFHPLEILDPVNDMVEDYATVMKYSIGSLIIQKILVEILAHNLFKWLMLGFGVLLTTSLLYLNGTYSSYIFKGFAFISLVRFMFVATILLSTLVDSTCLQKQTDDQMRIVKEVTDEVGFINNANQDLTMEEENDILQKIQDLRVQENELYGQIRSQDEIVSNAQSRMEIDKAKLAQIRGKKGVFERLNFFNDNEDIASAKHELSSSKRDYKKNVADKKVLTKQLEAVQEAVTEQQEKLNGDGGFIASMQRRIATVRSMFSIPKMKQMLENSIGAMLKLIALFVFKTLIMPITFLLLAFRSFKLVWGIDPRTFLNYEKNEKGEI